MAVQWPMDFGFQLHFKGSTHFWWVKVFDLDNLRPWDAPQWIRRPHCHTIATSGFPNSTIYPHALDKGSWVHESSQHVICMLIHEPLQVVSYINRNLNQQIRPWNVSFVWKQAFFALCGQVWVHMQTMQTEPFVFWKAYENGLQRQSQWTSWASKKIVHVPALWLCQRLCCQLPERDLPRQTGHCRAPNKFLGTIWITSSRKPISSTSQCFHGS